MKTKINNTGYLILCLVAIFLSSCVVAGRQGEDLRPQPDKFTQFTFKKECVEGPKDQLLAEIERDLKEKGTVLDLMKFYSDELQKDISTKSPYFDKLQKIFNCSIAPQDMQGYVHGAVVAFQSQELVKCVDINVLNLPWPLVRVFSPWTGKTFETCDPQKLKDITDGFETGEVPTTWGSNTYSTRTFRQKAAVDTMKALHIELEPATAEEIRTRDYDVKGFFFIGREGRSVNPDNKGRMVYQFNYRWPKLKTFPPDNYCIDEIVQIAEGLYMGQLLYATDMSRAYDPGLDPDLYRYRNFGYFLLLDEDWEKMRVEIGFDVVR
ncbi:MAG: hypothetical protein QME44_11185 [Thermodesulfobacteriota bacterium]|nr:hypothetical protein [Thermodesulfobacteriota bacterium]